MHKTFSTATVARFAGVSYRVADYISRTNGLAPANGSGTQRRWSADVARWLVVSAAVAEVAKGSGTTTILRDVLADARLECPPVERGWAAWRAGLLATATDMALLEPVIAGGAVVARYELPGELVA